jgi:hypothetical protein
MHIHYTNFENSPLFWLAEIYMQVAKIEHELPFLRGGGGRRLPIQ